MDHNTKRGYPHDPPPQYTQNSAPVFVPNPTTFVQPVITHQPAHVVHVVTAPAVGPDPLMVVCPSCHKNVLTQMKYEPTTRTHLAALGCCLIGLVPCAIIPYCTESCMNGNHYCPSCGTYIGTYAS